MSLIHRLVLVLTLLPTLIYAGFIKPPADIVFRQGTQTTGHVLCEIDPPPARSSIIWNIKLINENAKVVYSHPNFLGNASNKYSISSSAEQSGNFTLVIRRLTRQDSGEYTCQIDGRSSAAKLTVADPPGLPRITLPSGVLVENQSSTFSCVSEGGFPTPTFTWFLGSRQLSTTDHTDTEEVNGEARSELTIKLRHTDHMTSLKCMASNILNATSASSTLRAEFSPRVTLTPDALVVLKNTPFALDCSYTLNPERTSIKWFKDGNEVTSAANNQQLRVDAGISTDSQYKCVVENSQGSGEASTIAIVHYAPVLSLGGASPIVVNESSPAVIVCNVDAKPEATVRWVKGTRVVSNTEILSLPSVQRQDGGKYRCVASNTPTPTNGPAISESRELNVTVRVQYGPQVPIFELNPSSSSGEYRAGKRIELACKLSDSGVPTAIIKWYKSRQSTPVKVGGSLVLETPQVSDTDEYWCMAENIVASVSSARIEVSFIDVPRLLTTESSTAVNLSLDTMGYKLQCDYEGFPKPTIAWYRGDGLISDLSEEYTTTTEQITGSNIQHPYSRVRSTLSFSGSMREGIALYDFAKFRCQASNAAGESKNDYEIQINVMFTPKFEGFGKAGTDVGADVVVPCMVLSYPPAHDIKFYREGALIQSSDKYELTPRQGNIDGSVYRQRRELTIRSVKKADYGIYRCMATNMNGTGDTSISLQNTSIPDPPTGLTSSNLSWHSITLTWEAGFDGGYTQSYKIRTFEPNSELLKTEESAEAQHVVTGLRPGTNYLFKVSSVNQLGKSVSHLEQEVVTPKLYIPEATIAFDRKAMTIQISMNSTEYCTKLQGSLDGTSYTDVSKCIVSPEPISISGIPYTSYRVISCVPGRLDVCREFTSTSTSNGNGVNDGDEDKQKTIITGVVVSVFVVIIIIAVAVAIFMLRRKRRLQKSSASNAKSGHINPIMTPNGVPGEVHYSSHSGYNIHSDLELDDEVDGLPYGELKDHRVDSPMTSQPHENLEYVYASVQKKSSEQNKLNHGLEYDVNQHRPNSLNIHDPSSVSDNSGYDEEPPSPYREPNILSFIGDGAMAFRQYPSVSGSEYSTPDSKQVKKVVYEVIV